MKTKTAPALWITRPPPANLGDARLLRRCFIPFFCAPLTEIAYDNCATERLRRDIHTLCGQGMRPVCVFTSANAAKAAAGITADCVAVGAATAQAARACGFSPSRVTAPDAAAAARQIIAEAPYKNTVFLHVCGADIRADIAALLNKNGLRAEKRTVYEAVPNRADFPRERALLRAGHIKGVMFYSVKAALLWKKRFRPDEPVAARRKPAYYCFSPAIADAFDASGGNDILCSPHPGRAAFIRAVNAHYRARRNAREKY